LALVLLVVLLVGLNLKTVLGTFGSFAVASYTLYLLALIAAAWVLGAAENRHGTSLRSGPDAATSRQPWWWRVKASTIRRPT
jgi:hypothetical protein